MTERTLELIFIAMIIAGLLILAGDYWLRRRSRRG